MNAGQKWLQLLLDILGYEFDDGPLLSEGADHLIDKHPIFGRIFIISIAAVVTLHLANLLDPRYDIMAQSFWKTMVQHG